MRINYNNSMKHMDPQRLFAATSTVRELQTVSTLQRSGMSTKPLISGSIAVHIPHVYHFPVDLRQEAY